MSNNTQAALQKNDTLAAIVRHQLKNTRIFLNLLEEEQSLLLAGRIDNLALLVADKDRVVHQLTRLDAQLNQILVEMGFPEGMAGIKAWLAINHLESEDFRDWGELIDLTRLARQLNQMNANIISTWLQYTRQTLNVLYNAAGHVALYNTKGQII